MSASAPSSLLRDEERASEKTKHRRCCEREVGKQFVTCFRFPLVFGTLLTAWLAYGFIHGLHWIVLLVAIMRAGKCNSLSVRFCLLHFAFYWVMVIITAAGGGWCRAGNAKGCPTVTSNTGEILEVTMSRLCLWEHQTLQYQIIYTIHYVTLAIGAAHWILDFLHLPLWAWALSHGSIEEGPTEQHRPSDAELVVKREGPRTTKVNQFQKKTVLLYFPSKIADLKRTPRESTAALVASQWLWVYCVLSAALLVTLGWTILINWSTADGSLYRLAAALCAIIFVVVAMFWASAWCCLKYRKPSKESSTDSDAEGTLKAATKIESLAP